MTRGQFESSAKWSSYHAIGWMQSFPRLSVTSSNQSAEKRKFVPQIVAGGVVVP